MIKESRIFALIHAYVNSILRRVFKRGIDIEFSPEGKLKGFHIEKVSIGGK